MEGKTPISHMVVAGHHYGDEMKFTRDGKAAFNVAKFVEENKKITPTYERAKEKRGPLKCWFARGAFR